MAQKEENTVKVLISLPEEIHKVLKIEAIMKKNGNQKKINLQSIMIDRLERDIKTHPFEITQVGI